MEQAMPDSPRSRRVVVISTVLLLIAFDAARSVIGHVGYQTPVSMWHPDPEVYADMSWPPSSNVPANAAPANSREEFGGLVLCRPSVTIEVGWPG